MRSVSMLEGTKGHSLRIKLFDLVKIQCDFHYRRSGEHKQTTLSICNADTQCAVRRRLEFYAIFEVIIYKGLDWYSSRST